MAWRQLFRVQEKEQYFNCPHEVDFRESVRMFGTCLLLRPVRNFTKTSRYQY